VRWCWDRYALDPADAAKLWEHERLGAIAGAWSVDSCPAYLERASAMSKRVAKQKYQQDKQGGAEPMFSAARSEILHRRRATTRS
jgi:hypothetical protein